MKAYLRSPYYLLNRPEVSVLVEMHRDDAAFLAPNARPLASFYLNTTQAELIAAMDVAGDRWSDRELLLVGQPLLDAHPDWGGQDFLLVSPPDVPGESP